METDQHMNNTPVPAKEPATTNPPLVSVLMTLFNEERFVRSVFEDLIGQTYRNIEILVCDNCSTDGTWEIVQEFAQRDSRIQTHRHPSNIGAIGNFESALGMASGEFIMMVAGHDHHLPTFVEACAAELLKDPAVVMAYPRANFMDVAGKPLGSVLTNLDTRGMAPPARFNVLLWGLSYPYQIYGLFRREAFDGYDATLFLSPDSIFLAKAALIGAFAQVPEVLLHMRQNADYGDPKAHSRKLYENKREFDETRPDELYFEMLAEYIKLIKGHLPPGTERNAIISSIVLALATSSQRRLQDYSRIIAGAAPGPRRSDLDGAVDRFASEFEEMLFTRNDAEAALRQKAREDVLRQFGTDELVSLMSYRELAGGIARRIRRYVTSRMFKSR